MTSITESQRDSVSQFLTSQGLTFQPLLDEMTDHICSEAEEMISGDMTFEKAFQQIISELPQGHFTTIQSETMKTINNKFNLSRAFSFVALGALMIATIFKVLMLPGASEIWLVGIGALNVTLITVVFPDVKKKGRIRILMIAGGAIMLLLGYGFLIMHLSGASELKILGVSASIIGIIMNTLFVYRNASGRENLMTYMHEKHSPGIERFLLLALTPVVIYKLFRMFTDARGSVVDVMLIVVIYLAGLQLIAFFWRWTEKKSLKSVSTALGIIAAGTCLNLPMLGELMRFETRLVCVTFFSVVSAVLVYQLSDEDWKWMAIIPALIFVVLALMRFHIIPIYSNTAINVVVIATLVAGIFMAKKNELLRTYMILSLASFLIEYNMSISL